MSEIVDELGPAARERIAALRRRGRFFWVDASLTDSGADDLLEELFIPEDARQLVLAARGDTRPARRFYADGQHVVFGFSCFVKSAGAAAEDPFSLHAIDVVVVVTGDYLLTAHEERASLPKLLPAYRAEGRSEQYVVYAVLDAMVGTAFDALNEVELQLHDLEVITADLRASRVRLGRLRETSARLSDMRRRVEPHRGTFERIGEEITRVEGIEADSERYFERIYEQLNRLMAAIDAAADAGQKLIDLRLNETIYWLTVVATIFLPLTFLTGFFGMNFGWMVKQIDTAFAFVLLGVGSMILAAALIAFLVRRGTPFEPDENP